MSLCETYKTCGECLLSMNPFYGWCANSNKCTTQTKCLNNDVINQHISSSQSNLKWLNGVQLKLSKNGTTHTNLIDSMCVDIESVEPSFVYKDIDEWIENTLRKDIQQMANKENETKYD